MLPPHLLVSLRWLRDFRETNCLLYYLPDAVVTGAAEGQSWINGIADLADAKFRGVCRNVINPDIQWMGVRARYLTPTVDLVGYSSEAPAVGLAVSDDTEPEEVAVVIQRTTGLPGRNKRGRVFLPHVPSDFLEGSAIVAAHRAAYLEVAENIAENLTLADDTFSPATPDWKNNLLVPVTTAKVVGEVMSRRDRREPKRAPIYAAMPGM